MQLCNQNILCAIRRSMYNINNYVDQDIIDNYVNQDILWTTIVPIY